MNNNKVLVIDNKVKRRNSLVNNLQYSDFDVMEAHEGNLALNLIKEREPSIVMLDLVPPGSDGLKFCSLLKEKYPLLPLIIVSSNLNSQDIDKALASGVDDFIIKPFNPFELNARIRTVLRRISKEKEMFTKQLNVGPFVLEMSKRGVYKESKLIKLTEIEWQIMKVLMERVNEPTTKEILIEKVWGLHDGVDSRTVAVNIRRLREKIEAVPSKPEYLITIWGLGYYFQDGVGEMKV